MELPEVAVSGLTAFSSFGDYTAKHIAIYRDYYNKWLPEDAHISEKANDSL